MSTNSHPHQSYVPRLPVLMGESGNVCRGVEFPCLPCPQAANAEVGA